MSSGRHGMPRDLFTTLARGGGGPAAIGELVAAQRSRHLILLGAVAAAADPAGRPADRLARAGYHLLAQVQAANAGAAREVISYPSVGAWALRTLRGEETIPGAVPGGLASVAAAAALRAKMDFEIEVPVVNGLVVLPSLGAAKARGATAVVRGQPAEVISDGVRVTVEAGDPGWLELRSVRIGSLNVRVDDLDPFRMLAPDGEPAARLTPAQLAELARELRAGWDVLDPGVAADVAALARVIVPYTAPDGGHVSTSSPEAFGAIAMSPQPDRYTCAETLVHEAQHLKLCGLLDLVSLTGPEDGRRYYAPWRTDPRPLPGLLQGAYAFLGVGELWRRLRLSAAEDPVRRRGHQLFARWRDGVGLVVSTLLDSGQLTAAGREFVSQMAGVLAQWEREPVPPAALMSARQLAGQHLARWRSDHGDARLIVAPGVSRD
jgi:uncharacterized protein